MLRPPPANKRLGQHFLADPSYCRKIVGFAHVSSGCRVVEIGAGTGRLTRALLEAGARVLALEVDPRLAAWLAEDLGEFTAGGRLKILMVDVLSCDWAELVREVRSAFPLETGVLARTGTDGGRDGRIAVCGNLPYNIATRIIHDLAGHALSFGHCTFMVQREVAERLAARPGTKQYGFLSVLVQSVWNVEPGFDVPPGAFRPRPKVDSSVLRLVPRPQVLSADEYARLRRLVEVAFRHPRKTLRNNLARAGFPKPTVERAFEKLALPPQIRPEEISPEGFQRLNRVLSSEP